MVSDQTLSDAHIAEFLGLARSANIHFEIVQDRLHMRAVNPNWAMWKPCRHLLDEIGQARIEAYVRAKAREDGTVARCAAISAERLHLAADAMR